MANTNKPFGLKPVGPLKGTNYYMITNNYGTALFVGDPVVRVAAGSIERATAGATNPILGVVTELFKQNGPKTGRPDQLEAIQSYAATPGTTYDWWAVVADDPNQEFLVQDDGDTTQVAVADLGSNFNIIFTHAGNTTTGVSGCELDSSSTGQDATYQLLLVGLVNEWDTDAGAWNTYGANAKHKVRINLHQNAGTARAGI